MSRVNQERSIRSKILPIEDHCAPTFCTIGKRCPRTCGAGNNSRASSCPFVLVRSILSIIPVRIITDPPSLFRVFPTPGVSLLFRFSSCHSVPRDFERNVPVVTRGSKGPTNLLGLLFRIITVLSLIDRRDKTVI